MAQVQKQPQKLTGAQKAAILMIALGPEISSSILKRLPEHMIEKITYEIANTTKISVQQKEGILKEFKDMTLAQDYINQGGIEYAKNLLTKALGSQKAKEIIDTVSEITQQRRPFAIARKADSQQLFNTISKEHPQTIALILCYMQPYKTATILRPAGRSAGRCSLQNCHHEHHLAGGNKAGGMVLEKKLSTLIGSDYASVGGVSTLWTF